MAIKREKRIIRSKTSRQKTLHAELLKRGYTPARQRENETTAEIIKIG